MRTAALVLALTLPTAAHALELPEDLFTIELGPTFRGLDVSNDDGFEASVSSVFLGFDMSVVMEDGIGMFSVQSDLLSGLAMNIFDQTEPAASGARILRWTIHAPAWDMSDDSAIGVGVDIDWASLLAPANPETGTFTKRDVVAGSDWVSVGLSADWFMITGEEDFAHAWVTLGALLDFDNAFGDHDGAYFVGPLVRVEAEYFFSLADLITLHPRVGGSWYFVDEVERFSEAWAASTVFEWTIALGVGLELDFDDD